MINRREQRGITAIGWLIILALVVVVAMMLLRLVPVYIEHFGVTGSLRSLKDEVDSGWTPAGLRQTLIRRLEINNVESVQVQDISISREGGAYVVTIDYEARVPFVANVSFVVSFHDEAEVPAR